MRFHFLILSFAFLSLARAQDTNGVPVIAPEPSTNQAPASPAMNAATPATTTAAADKASADLVQLRAANAKLSAGDTAGALAMVNVVLQGNPQSVPGYALRGAIYSAQKLWDKAQADFNQALQLAPNNPLIKFNLAEAKFAQKQYDAARPGFLEISASPKTDIGDLAAYKVFLCDLFAGHMDAAQKELDAFNQVGSQASYYYSNAAWDFAHKNATEAVGWLTSASNIYSPQKNGFYRKSLIDQGYLVVKTGTPP